jgi:hypothetical protein
MKTHTEYQQNQSRHASRLCHHVTSQQYYSPRHCILNHECYHCVYDQWLFEMDSETVRKRLSTETTKASLSVAD